MPSRRFSHMHVDLVGPLPTSAEGWSYIMTIMDMSTRWIEAAPVWDMATATCADTLIAAWVARFGVLAVIISDRGRSSPPWSSPASLWTVRAAGCRLFGALAAGLEFHPYQTHPTASTGDQQAAQQARWVYIRHGGAMPPLTPPFAGPYKVAEAGVKTFKVMVGGQRQLVFVNRLKPHMVPAPVRAADTSRHGQLPK